MAEAPYEFIYLLNKLQFYVQFIAHKWDVLHLQKQWLLSMDTFCLAHCLLTALWNMSLVQLYFIL